MANDNIIRHAAYKRFISGFVVMVLIEETFEAGSARLIDMPQPTFISPSAAGR
jgi:hypothetical protein